MKSLRTVALQAAAEKDFIVYDEEVLWNEKIEKFGRCRLEYGRGHEYQFDFEKIENVIVNSFVANKSFFVKFETTKLTPVRFKNEIFSNHQQIMNNLNMVVEQKPLVDKEAVKTDGDILVLLNDSCLL
jgi:hypothetical protein